MPFAQLVIGPPGSGKTTYIQGLTQFLPQLSRPFSVINLDPANDRLPYKCHVDINKLISVRDVMAELQLGPNAAMIYCIEYLQANMDWLVDRLKSTIEEQGEKGYEYLLFDLPGQVELSTNHPSLRRILTHLEQSLKIRFVAIHLCDATHITDSSRFISLLLLSLRAMLALQLPHINVLSKVDLLEDQELQFNLDFYTQVQDLTYLGRTGKLDRTIANLVQDFGLVQFETLAVEDKRSMFRLLRVVDKAVGYVYLKDAEFREGASVDALLSTADRGDPLGWGDALDVQERYVNHPAAFQAHEAQQADKQWERKV